MTVLNRAPYLTAFLLIVAAVLSCGGSTPRDVVAEKIAGGALIVDVRSSAEFAAGHYDGAINIPYDEIGKRHAELGDKARPIVLYCRSGRRSAIAAKTLQELGFADVTDAGGLTDMPPRPAPR